MTETRLPRRRRSSAVAELQAAVAMRLIVAGLFFAGIVVAAAWYYTTPQRLRSPAGVAPTLNAFLSAAAAGELAAATGSFSVDAMRSGARDQVSGIMSDPLLLPGYQSATIIEFRRLPPRSQGDERAAVLARVDYEWGPPGRLEAEVVLEEGRWRLESVTLVRQW